MYFSPTETIFGIHGRVSRVAATVFLRRLDPEVSIRPLVRIPQALLHDTNFDYNHCLSNTIAQVSARRGPFQARRTWFRRGERPAGRAANRDRRARQAAAALVGMLAAFCQASALTVVR